MTTVFHRQLFPLGHKNNLTRLFHILTIVCGLTATTILQNCSDTTAKNNDKSIPIDFLRKKCVASHNGFRTDTVNIDRLTEIDTIFFKKFLDGHSVIGDGCGRTTLKADRFSLKWVFYDFKETDDIFTFSIIENLNHFYIFYYVIVDKKDKKIKRVVKYGCYNDMDEGQTEFTIVQQADSGFMRKTTVTTDTWENDTGWIIRYDSVITESNLFNNNFLIDTTTFFTRTDTTLYEK